MIESIKFLGTYEQTLWLAGLLDGEAYFALHKVKGVGKKSTEVYLSPKLIVEMVDLDVIETLASLWNCSISTHEKDNPNWNTSYRVSIYGKRAGQVMNTILPYMSARRTKVIREVLQKWNENRVSFGRSDVDYVLKEPIKHRREKMA